MPRTLLVSLCLLPCACQSAAAPPAATPVAAAAPSPQPSTPPESASLQPAAAVVSLALPCREDERKNGVDDDCDGHIDEDVGGTPAALELSLAWYGSAALTLTTEPALSAAVATTCSERGACMARLSDAGWRRQPVTVHVSRDEAQPQAAPVTASLCAAGHGTSLGCHNFTLAPGQARQVAQITAP